MKNIDNIHQDIIKLSKFNEEIKERQGCLGVKEYFSISKINLKNYLIVNFKSENNYGYVVFLKQHKEEIFSNSLKDGEIYYYNKTSIHHKKWIDEFYSKFKKLKKLLEKVYDREEQLIKIVNSISKEI